MPKILLVEDYSILRNLYVQILKREYKCCGASSAEEAIALLEKKAFDLIIAALLLPDMSGVELLRYLREKYPALPLIMMSGSNARFRPEDFIRLGAVSYLEKPFPLCDLTASVEQARKWERVNVEAEPRSAYLLIGPARREGEHSIPPVDALRYSNTFRRLREG